MGRLTEVRKHSSLIILVKNDFYLYKVFWELSRQEFALCTNSERSLFQCTVVGLAPIDQPG